MNMDVFLWVVGILTMIALGLCSWALLRVVAVGEKMIELKGTLELNVGLIGQSLNQLTADLEKVANSNAMNRLDRVEAQIWGVRDSGGDSKEIIRMRGYLHWMTNWAMYVQNEIDSVNKAMGRASVAWPSVDAYLRRAGEAAGDR